MTSSDAFPRQACPSAIQKGFLFAEKLLLEQHEQSFLIWFLCLLLQHALLEKHLPVASHENASLSCYQPHHRHFCSKAWHESMPENAAAERLRHTKMQDFVTEFSVQLCELVQAWDQTRLDCYQHTVRHDMHE